ncbi:hypothetical protein R3W88_025838 [Solanum pinnatisectum]|uniref:DUF4283 domain-containing protein n=1 Tax=Solanum pinnatisectum TaxID=50273 RepID=A0AAV9M479_9SOLN|nr:hypothetical protein R3W88_025838 [Solanum pinnatisectum]
MSFSFLDLDSYIQEVNLQYALVAKFSYGRPDMIDLRKIFTRHFEIKGDCNLGLLDHRHFLVRLSNREDFMEVYSRAGVNNQYQCQIQRWTPWFNPKEETPIALAWISFPSLSTKIFSREALFSLASAVGLPLQVDKATTGKSRPSVARVKMEINLLSSLPNRVRMFFNDEKIGVVKEVLQKIVYDKLPSYCTTFKHQGHKEEECRLTMEIEGGLIEETKINGEKFEGDLRSILDEKKKILTLKQTGKEVTLPNSSNINFGKNSVDKLNKEKHATTTIPERVNAPGLLRLTAAFGHKEATKAMLLGMLTSKISE